MSKPNLIEIKHRLSKLDGNHKEALLLYCIEQALMYDAHDEAAAGNIVEEMRKRKLID